MATNFPTSLDTLTNPATSDQLNSPSHAAQHANANDAIEALEAKVGINNSASTTSLEYRLTQVEDNLGNSSGDFIPLSVLGQPSGPASLDADGNLIVPENKIIIEGATADAHELTLQAPDVTSDITVTLPNVSGTLATTVDVSNLGALKSNIDSPTFTGTPLAPTAISATNTTQIATTEFVKTAISNLVNSAPNTLDTLNELATALGNDANFATTTATSIGDKVSKAGGDVITSSLPGVIGLTVKGAASQTANLQEWQNSSGTVLSFIRSDGYARLDQGLQFGTMYSYAGTWSIDGGNSFKITNSSASYSPLIVKGAASQSANLTEWQNSGGTALAWFTSNGTLNVRYARATTNDSTVIPFIAKGAASQTANLQEWQNSAGTVLSKITATGMLDIIPASGDTVNFRNASGGLTLWGGNSSYYMNTGLYMTGGSWAAGRLGVDTAGAANIGLVVRGAASQTANLQEWQNSAGTAIAKVDSNGAISSISGGFFGTASGPIDSGNYLAVRPWAANHIPFIVKGFAAQTGDLTRWLNDAGAVLAKVDSTGAMFTTTAAANTNTTQVATTAYVQAELADLVNSAPATLDTLKELSDALGADANFATTVTNNLALKAPLASPALTGTPTAPTAAVGTDSTQVATTAFVIDQIDASTQPGALYQTTAPTSPEIGQIWIDSDENVTTFDSNIIRRKAITATAGQTVFTADLPFIDGFEQIFMNGLLLVKTTDYTTSNSNTVTLTSAAAASDVIEIVSVTGANSVNTYTQAETDSLLAANTSVAPLSISANTNLLAKKRYFVTSASALTLTLPASPTLNDEIQILDASGNASTYNITVARNGRLINGNAGNLIIDNNGGWYTLLYTGATYGWKVG